MVESGAGPSHVGNVVAALALALTDRIAAAIGDTDGLPISDVTALSALRHIMSAPSVEQLSRVVGLTHSGTVRLVNRLAAAGLVEHGPGPDGRTSTVALTDHGQAAAGRVGAARAGVVESALAGLGKAERTELDRLCGRVLTAMIRGPGATGWICRWCDTGACGRYHDQCPIGREITRTTTAAPTTEENT